MVSFRFSPGTLVRHVVIGQIQLLIDGKALGHAKELKSRVKDMCLELIDRETSYLFISNCYQYFTKYLKYIKKSIFLNNICFPLFNNIYKYDTYNSLSSF